MVQLETLCWTTRAEVCREDLVARWDGREHPSFDAMPWESWRQERFGRLR
jgi:hypothetical protein